MDPALVQQLLALPADKMRAVLAGFSVEEQLAILAELEKALAAARTAADPRALAALPVRASAMVSELYRGWEQAHGLTPSVPASVDHCIERLAVLVKAKKVSARDVGGLVGQIFDLLSGR